ncbi:outer membrane beta-barrel protein [Flavobacterium akiainvivens]|nr:outer membrane beta-barrel protein [Flavobacterium akiainvivens]
MKKSILAFLMLIISLSTFSQESHGQFSLEGSYGLSIASTPNLTDTKYFNIGGRYMFNEFWGIKAFYSQDKFRTDATPATGVDYKIISAQAVYNVGRALSLPRYTGGFVNVLAHAGLGYTYAKSNIFPNDDNIGNVTIGITPQIYIIKNLTLHTDLSYTLNIKQHYRMDGYPHDMVDRSNFFTGGILNASIGLTLYLGKHGSDNDWR